ncbi:MAG: hypothetical protein RLZZ324_1320 [Candidatus Parcubacteria bacterium]|jgi:adenosine deaminase
MKPYIKAGSHDHLDGSIPMEKIILELYRMAGKTFPFASVSAWRAYFTDPHSDMIAKFGTVTGVLQTEEALQLAAETYVRHRALQGMAYQEPKFAPQYHVFGGLSLKQVIAAVHKGCALASNTYRVDVLPVACIGREADPDRGVEIARAILEFDGEVGMDMACNEADFPPERHLPAYALTFGTNVRRDCHAGEWVSPEPADTYRQRLLANVRTAVEVLRCHSVGHARPLKDDPELVKRVVAENIRVAMCPLSNLGGGLIKNVGELGIAELLDAGVCLTVDGDDDLCFPDLAEVAAACDAAYGFTSAQCRALEDNPFKGALMPAHRRRFTSTSAPR